MALFIVCNRSTSAICARGKARVANSTSINARRAASSSIRSLVRAGVWNRPLTEMLRAPSAASRFNASRTGVTETPNSSATPRRVIACPGRISPYMIRMRNVR